MAKNEIAFTGPTIIDTVERSSMASNWKEHLCLSRLTDGQWRLDVLGWEALGEVDEYWDEDADDYVLPDEIDGNEVVGVEDGIIVVANLVPTGNTEAEYQFTDFVWSDFVDNFEAEASFWCNDQTKAMIEEALQRAKS